MRHAQLLVGPACLLLACGGGADTTSSTTPGVSPPALQIGVGAPKAFVGDSVTLTWSTQRATSCQATGAWSGAQGIQGSIRVAFTTGGVKSFLLSCTGTGGTTTDSTRLIVPLPVYPTSYENAKNIDTPVQSVAGTGLAPLICQNADARG